MQERKDHPLRSREDLQKLAACMISCVAGRLSPQKSWLNAGESGARYPHKTAWTEGFLRPLFGLVPFRAGNADGRDVQLWDVYRRGIIDGTDPDSPQYWGALEGKDQKIVEMTTLGLALSMVPEHVRESLSNREKDNADMATNNWIFFPVTVNVGLCKRFWLACGVLGVKSRSEADAAWNLCPGYVRENHSFRITDQGVCREFSEK